jgi:hypothetical protein
MDAPVENVEAVDRHKGGWASVEDKECEAKPNLSRTLDTVTINDTALYSDNGPMHNSSIRCAQTAQFIILATSGLCDPDFL